MTPPIPEGYEATAIVQAPDGTVTVKLRKVKTGPPEATPCQKCKESKGIADLIEEMRKAQKTSPQVPSFPRTEPPVHPYRPWEPPVSPFGQPWRRNFQPYELFRPIWTADGPRIPAEHAVPVLR